MPKQFWVIGADYRDLGFHEPVEGTREVIGPFTEYSEASTAWRQQAMATRHKATTRYTIVVNAGF